MTRLALLGLVALGACVRSGPRPVPPAAEEVVNAPVGVTRLALQQAVSNLGLPLRPTDLAGQVETEYVDMASYLGEAATYPLAERLVRFIVTALPDPNSAGTLVVVRALYDPFRTGLSNTRRGDRGIPQSHPAMEVVRDLVKQIRRQAEGG